MTKNRLRLFALIALEGVGVIVAVCAAFAGYFLWRAEQGPVSLDVFRPAIERLVARRLPTDYQLRIGTITIEAQRGLQDGPALSHGTPQNQPRANAYTLILRDLSLKGARDLSTINIPQARLTIDKTRLLRAGTSVRAIDIAGAHISVERSAANITEKPRDPVSAAPSNPLQFLANVKNNRVLNNGLDRIHIGGLSIDFTDQYTEQYWTGKGGVFVYQRSAQTGFRVESKMDLETARGPASFSLSVINAPPDQTDVPTVATTIRLEAQKVPIGDMVSLVLRDNKTDFTAPISGLIALDLDKQDQVSDIRFDLQSEDGKLLVDEQYMPIASLVLRGGYNQPSDSIEIKDFGFDIGASRGTLSGTIDVLTDDASGLQGVAFDLMGENTVLDTLGFFDKPVGADRVTAKGRYILDGRTLDFSYIDLQTGTIGFEGSLKIERPIWPDGSRRSAGVYADVKTRGRITHTRLKELWPGVLSPLSRKWVRTRIKKGYVENLVFSMNLVPGQLTEVGYIPDEALKLTFGMGNITAEIIPGMTPISRIFGRGLLLGNSLDIDIDRSLAGDVSVQDARVYMPKFTPRGVPHEYSFDALGNARDMLMLINEEPLSLLGASELDPNQVAGDARVSIKISRTANGPGKEATFGYDGTGQFDNLTFLEAFGDLDLTSANGTLRLLTDRFEIKGDAKLGTTPVEYSWRQNFDRSDLSSRLTLAGTFDAAIADLLGIPTRSFLSGPIDIALDARGRFRTFRNIQIEADFSDAELRMADYGWVKPEGEIAALSLLVQYGDDKNQSGILKIDGTGLNIQGNYSLFPDGRLSTLKMPSVKVEGFADFAMEAKRERGQPLEASVSGAYINLAPLIEHTLSNPGSNPGPNVQADRGQEQTDEDNIDWGRGIKARLRFDQLELRNGVALSDTALDLWHDSEKLQVLNLSGFDRANRPVSVNLSNGSDVFVLPRSDDQTQPGERIVRAETTDIGDLMNGIFGIASLRGGEGFLRLVLADEPGAPLSGLLEARNVKIVNAPMLAKLFAAGSLEALADLMSDKGISIETVITEFDITDGVITIQDANATGPSVGISANGTIELDGSDVALSGAIAPIYQLNSFLGNTPLIGNLLVNRKGEGFLALSYEISGEVTAPQVTIKPLSALAPGVFRRAFEPEENKDPQD